MPILRNRFAPQEPVTTLETRVLLDSLEEVAGENAPATASESPVTLELLAADNALLQKLHDVSEQTGKEYVQAYAATDTGLEEIPTTVNSVSETATDFLTAGDADVVAHTHPHRTVFVENNNHLVSYQDVYPGDNNPDVQQPPSRDITPHSASDYVQASLFADAQFNGFVSLVQEGEDQTFAFVPTLQSGPAAKAVEIAVFVNQIQQTITDAQQEQILAIRDREEKIPSDFTQAEEIEVLLAGAVAGAEVAKGAFYVGRSGSDNGATLLLKVTEQNLISVAEALAEEEADSWNALAKSESPDDLMDVVDSGDQVETV